MKTTIEINDSLLETAKMTARSRGMTMKAVIEAALRRYLEDQNNRRQEYKFVNHPFEGNGVCEGIQEGKWEEIRSRIYEGRGG